MNINNETIFYDIHGKPLTMDEWSKSFKKRFKTSTKNKLGFFISTVHLGIDHSFIPGATPIIFETMVFHNSYLDIEMARYETLEEAIDGHVEMVHKYQNPLYAIYKLIKHKIMMRELMK